MEISIFRLSVLFSMGLIGFLALIESWFMLVPATYFLWGMLKIEKLNNPNSKPMTVQDYKLMGMFTGVIIIAYGIVFASILGLSWLLGLVM